MDWYPAGTDPVLTVDLRSLVYRAGLFHRDNKPAHKQQQEGENNLEGINIL